MNIKVKSIFNCEKNEFINVTDILILNNSVICVVSFKLFGYTYITFEKLLVYPRLFTTI